jgi:hypothetical protein
LTIAFKRVIWRSAGVPANVSRSQQFNGGDEQTARLNGLKSRQTPDKGFVGSTPTSAAPYKEASPMESNANEMVRHLFEIVQGEYSILCDLERNNLLLIESSQPGVSQEARAAALATVRASLLDASELGDKIAQFALKVR